MSSKMTQIATLFAAGSVLAAAAAPLGASPFRTAAAVAGTTAAFEASGSCGAGSCGGKAEKKDEKKPADAKKAKKAKAEKDGSCGAGSCGGKADKKDEKKAEGAEKK